jgi:hypothetical protein
MEGLLIGELILVVKGDGELPNLLVMEDGAVMSDIADAAETAERQLEYADTGREHAE